jgi:hypothetical protein
MVFERKTLVKNKKIKKNGDIITNDTIKNNVLCLKKSDYIKVVLKSLEIGLFGDAPHSLGWDKAMKLVKITNLSEGDICWEIGCGVPILALVLGMVTKTFIIATELSKIFYFICY